MNAGLQLMIVTFNMLFGNRQAIKSLIVFT